MRLLLCLPLALLFASCGPSDRGIGVGELFEEPASGSLVRAVSVGDCSSVRDEAPALARELHGRGRADNQAYVSLEKTVGHSDLPLPEISDRTEGAGSGPDECVAYVVATAFNADGSLAFITTPDEIAITGRDAFLETFEPVR